MKIILVSLITLFVYLPVHSQELSLAYNESLESSPTSSLINRAPQIAFEGTYLSLKKEETGTILFSNISYPRMAAKAGITADCRVNFIVRNDASIEKIQVLGQSCDYFTDVIEQRLESHTWKPAVEEGRTVDYAVGSEISFRLR